MGFRRFFSKDHAVTVAVCNDTLTKIRYTTLMDATPNGRDSTVGTNATTPPV
jgi:hypothetical protein